MKTQKLLSLAISTRGLVVLMLAVISINGAIAAPVTTNLVFTTQPVGTTVGAPLPNVVVQIRDSRGTNISQAGTTVALVLSRGTGLSGVTNLNTDASGKAVFTNLAISQIGNGDVLQAATKILKTVTSSAFNITQGKTTNVLTASTNVIAYGQPVTLTSAISVVAPSSGLLSGTVTFKDGSAVIGTSALNASGQASLTTTNRFTSGAHNFTASFSGNTNFAASTSAALPVTVSKLTLIAAGIIASNKIYDAKTTATLNVSNAMLVGVLSGDSVTLNAAAAKGVFADKYVGTAKSITITGLTITGTSAGNYSLTQAVAKANISTASLTVTAKGVNKLYDGTTSAVVTLADNRIAGDLLTNSYVSAAFTNKNIGTGKLVSVSGVAISGADAVNYILTSTNAAATANITVAALTVSGIAASNKVYDAKTTAGLNLGAAALVGAMGGDVVSLVKTNAKGVFANRNIGVAKTVTISGLTITGTDAGNYTLTQPATAASITPASLIITAKGVNKVYDGSLAATVTLADNRFSGDVLTESIVSANFTNSLVGTNRSIVVTGISCSGTDAANYVLSNTSASASANITAATLLVAADKLARPFGVTNPPLTYVLSGFINGETAVTATTGSPALTTTAKTNSVVGAYPITISKGTLAAANYVFTFSNGVLTVNPAATVSLVTSGLNPAQTNQNITFVTKVSATSPGAPAPTGLVRFKSNGTNTIGSPVTLTNGATTLVIPAAALGRGSVMVTAEFADPSGNFNASTNSIAQSIVVAPPTTPSIGKVTIAPPKFDGTMQATLSGTPGATFILEASSDLVHWTPVSTNVADTNGFISIVESNAIAYPSRYYRGMMPSP
ncbi:MAG: YDG domain-containing protein [Verrucomicrobiae bacterium]|nr:YDG domain-containing protein [Verrucomicrobiae bacterium]